MVVVDPRHITLAQLTRVNQLGLDRGEGDWLKAQEPLVLFALPHNDGIFDANAKLARLIVPGLNRDNVACAQAIQRCNQESKVWKGKKGGGEGAGSKGREKKGREEGERVKGWRSRGSEWVSG